MGLGGNGECDRALFGEPGRGAKVGLAVNRVLDSVLRAALNFFAVPRMEEEEDGVDEVVERVARLRLEAPDSVEEEDMTEGGRLEGVKGMERVGLMGFVVELGIVVVVVDSSKCVVVDVRVVPTKVAYSPRGIS